MHELDLAGKRVLIREDLNVPIRDGRVTGDQRVRAAVPTIEKARTAGAKVILMSHLGRPREGEFDPQLSLQPVANLLSEILGVQVPVIGSHLHDLPRLDDGQVVMLENVRFNVGEKDNDDALAQRYAAMGDVFVMDAFGTAHRAQASTHGVAKFIREACAGPLLCAELDALARLMENPRRPMTAIVGGAKVSTKLSVMKSLSTVVDQLIPGGGIANTFIAAAGFNVGKSLYEPDLIPAARDLMREARANGADIPVPTDVVVGAEFSPSAGALTKPVDRVDDADMIFDIGPDTARRYAELMRDAGTILWNGPLGVFEFDQFGHGTEAVGRAIADSDAFSVAGGGDTLAALDKYGIASRISYVSTGGGAFLEFLEGQKLPAVVILERRGSVE